MIGRVSRFVHLLGLLASLTLLSQCFKRANSTTTTTTTTHDKLGSFGSKASFQKLEEVSEQSRGGPSRSDHDSRYFPPYRELVDQKEVPGDAAKKSNIKTHKPLLPLSTRDVLGLFIAAAGLMISAVGGIGGGGILIPIYILIMDFSPKFAIPLSSITVFGGALANSVFNFRKRHPLADRPLIDWDLILVMEPLTIAGALVGAILNKILPEFFIIMMLVILLGYTAKKTITKGISMYEKEKQTTIINVISDGTNVETEMTMIASNDDDDDDDDNINDNDNDNFDSKAKVATQPPEKIFHKLDSIVKESIRLHEEMDEQLQDIELQTFGASIGNKSKPRVDVRNDKKPAIETEVSLNQCESEADKKEPMKEETNRNQTNCKMTTTEQGGAKNTLSHETRKTSLSEDVHHAQNSDFDEFITEILDLEEELYPDARNFSENESMRTSNSSVYGNESDELKAILEEERYVPLPNVKSLTIMFVSILIVNTIKGGGSFKSPIGITCGSVAFWFTNLFMITWLFLFSVGARFHLLKRHMLKINVGYEYLDCDIIWNEKTTIVFPSICCLAGFFAGMFGVGGGIIKGPLMLAMGVNAKVSSATSACMILFTSSTTTISFTVFGLLKYDYALVCLLIGFFFTFLVHVILDYAGKKYAKDSYVAFSIGGVVLLSAILMGVQSIISLFDENSTIHQTDRLCSVNE